MKQGIVMVSFGTTYHDTRIKNIEAIADMIRQQFPDRLFCQAYSSDRVRHILAERDKLVLPDIRQALAQMQQKEIGEVTILPTHLIDGYENHRIRQIVQTYQGSFERLLMADALLARKEDYQAVAEALWDSLYEMAQERIVILMGHGSKQEADASYLRMEKALQRYANREIYIATVEGNRTIEDVLTEMEKRHQKEKPAVLLMPFMLVAGDHARHDMVEGEASFYAKLQRAGYQTECLQRGIGEYEKIRKIYLERIQRAEKEWEHGHKDEKK